jgi:hypothetical protein
LAQQLPTPREGVEELIVEVVAIGEDDQGGLSKVSTSLPLRNTMERDLPLPWVCHTTPPRWLPWVAAITFSTARLTA